MGQLNSIMNHGIQFANERRKRSARYSFIFATERRRANARPCIYFRFATRQRRSILWGSRGRKPMVFSTSAARTTTQPKGAACTTLLTARHNEGQWPTSFSRQLRNDERKIGTAAVLGFQTKDGYYYWVSQTAPQVSRHFSSSSTDHIIVNTRNIDYIIRY